MDMDVRSTIREELAKFSDGLEDRLAMAMTKALDTVMHEMDGRLRQLEEDQARILRHLGMKSKEVE